MSAFGRKCVTLREQGCTLHEIMQMTGRAKSTIYHHIQNIPLPEERVREWRAKAGARIAQARKGKSVYGRHPIPFSYWTPDTVSLLAHFSFDGWVAHAHCAYSNRSKTLITKVEDLMKLIYPYEPKRRLDPKTGVRHSLYYNVELASYLRSKQVELFNIIPYAHRVLKRDFLKAFFDDEGCVNFNPARNTRRIRGYQKNAGTLYLVKDLLMEFEITATIKHPNEVVISGKSNLEKFQKEINFSPGVRINGNRSNSIWKEPLEKREILRRAIASFRPVGSNGVHRGTREN